MAEKYTAIYVRVSSEGQSTKSQKPDLEVWAKSQDGPIRCIDDKFTGRSMDRPGWARIEEDIKSGKVKAVALWRIDRLVRTAS
jgi:site-specific DNA recombinase